MIITINAGSSTLKVAAFDARSFVRVAKTVTGTTTRPAETLARALDAMPKDVDAIGHRIVHGGHRFERAVRVTPDVIAALRDMVMLDPDHMPAELAIVAEAQARFPAVPHVACFDTAFHRAMPRVAKLVPVPRHFGIERFGFHGLSYAYLMDELGRMDPVAQSGRVVLAHLGAGASLAAVANGQPMETTMGFTPTSGIPMATRSGDLDPGVLLHLARTRQLGVDALDDLVNRQSGLLGLSETSSDMRELLALEASDIRAAEAIALFCHQVKKSVGALATVLGGVDTLVFSGGIGENAAPIRARITRGLVHLGVELDEERNERHAPVVSTATSPCTVRVMPTDEEQVIARQTAFVVHEGAS